MKTGRSFWTVLAVVVITTSASIMVNELMVFRLMVLWVGIFFLSFIWTYFSLHGVDLKRYSRDDRIEAGGYLREVYEIHNNSFFGKIWLEIIDVSTIPFSASSRVITRIGSREKRSFSTYTQVYKRGYYELGPTIIRSGDLLGIFQRDVLVNSEQNILVTPLILEINKLDEPSGYLPGGKPISRKTNSITPFATGVDEYQPGEPLNKIHWLSTARMNKLMVKEFDYDPQANVFIIVDMAEDVQWDSIIDLVPKKYWMMDFRSSREIVPSSYDYLCAIAASLTNSYIHRNFSVGLISRDQGWQLLAAERGERQLIKVLETLALSEGKGDLTLGSVVKFQIHSLPRGSHVWIVTPGLSPDVLTAAEEIRMRGMDIQIAALDAKSFGIESKVQESIRELGLDDNVRIISYSKNLDEIRSALEGIN